MNRKQTLDAAAACVLTDRQRTHGPIEDSFGLIASLWSAYLSIPVTPFAVANLMTLLKIARAKGNPANADNQVDGAGYQACAAELADNPLTFLRTMADTAVETVAGMAGACCSANAPNAAPVTPQSTPEGDHSQTDARTQGDAIPLDSDDMWHNPENYPLTAGEKADGWRFLTKSEKVLPPDTMVKLIARAKMTPWDVSRVFRKLPTVTYFTRTPLPGTASADNVHATTP